MIGLGCYAMLWWGTFIGLPVFVSVSMGDNELCVRGKRVGDEQEQRARKEQGTLEERGRGHA